MPGTKNKKKRRKMNKASDDQLEAIRETCNDLTLRMDEAKATFQASLADQLKAYKELTLGLVEAVALSIGVTIEHYPQERDFLRTTPRHGLGRAIREGFFPADLAEQVIAIRGASTGGSGYRRKVNTLRLKAKELRGNQGGSSSNRALIANARNDSVIGKPLTPKTRQGSSQHGASHANLKGILETCDQLTLQMAKVQETQESKLEDQLVEYQDATYQLLSDVAASIGERIEDYPPGRINDFFSGTRRGLIQAIERGFFPEDLANLVVDIRRTSTLGRGYRIKLDNLRQRAQQLKEREEYDSSNPVSMANHRNESTTDSIHPPFILEVIQHSTAHHPVFAVPAAPELSQTLIEMETAIPQQQHEPIMPFSEATSQNSTTPLLTLAEAAILRGIASTEMDTQRAINQYGRHSSQHGPGH
jgi:hypothetical protein